MPTELTARLIAAFRWVGDPDQRYWFAGRTGWLNDPVIVRDVGAALVDLFPDAKPDLILGPDRSGLGLGVLVAAAAGAGFAAAQKDIDRLADSDEWVVERTPSDYRGRNMPLAVRRRLIPFGSRVLIVDDWADSGGQLLAMKKLVVSSGAHVEGSVVIVDALNDARLRRELGLRSLLNSRELRWR
ncbi:phosphoribosyltransferase family protein [Amnibacterium flavum]|uniref:Adenine phosphoribosyltransferase n=1 Tax=Amnibacterium flavum TaxID=2173173 RepID=A0A2V1HXT6_9MICO|nr:phosphoribosyltransferase family protein [Amnibacterium flavum]PVZ95507.1 adenine phosphoribosyltransferase [Amnibacterium flavum]